jgi:hypothetical protein
MRNNNYGHPSSLCSSASLSPSFGRPKPERMAIIPLLSNEFPRPLISWAVQRAVEKVDELSKQDATEEADEGADAFWDRVDPTLYLS